MTEPTLETLATRLSAAEESVRILQAEMKSVLAWQGEHHGRIEAWWATQFRWNAAALVKFEKIFEKIGALQRLGNRAMAAWAVVLFVATMLANKYL